MSKASPLFRLWAWPVALALLSASGLISALVSDGWGDAWSWFGLGLPVLVMVWFGWLRKPRAGQPAFEASVAADISSSLSARP